MSGTCSLRTIFHFIVMTHYWCTLYYVINMFYLPRTQEFNMFHSWGGHYRFLTNWDLLLQAVFFIICVINDFMGTNDVSPRKTPIIRKIKDYFHVALGFPIGSFVAITFWSLYAVDRELVFPKALDPYFPLWLNHIMHTNVFIFSFVELITSFRVYPSRKAGLGGLILFMLTYLVWTLIIFSKTGKWVYPVMEVLNWPARIAFMATLLAFSIGLYFVGELINNWVWKKELQRQKRNDDKQVPEGVALCDFSGDNKRSEASEIVQEEDKVRS